MSPADYDALLAKQDGVCATCGKPSKETLCVDHCHATGTIRGLLCRKCNIGLGCYDDDPATLVTALAYLACGRRDRTGAAAQRALAARAALPPGRAGVTVWVEARSRDRLDADAAPAGDSAMRPMRNALDAQFRREGDDGEGGTASLAATDRAQACGQGARRRPRGDQGNLRPHGLAAGRGCRRGRAAGGPSMQRYGVIPAVADFPPPPRVSGTRVCGSKGSTAPPTTASRRCRPVQTQQTPTCGSCRRGMISQNEGQMVLFGE